MIQRFDFDGTLVQTLYDDKDSNFVRTDFLSNVGAGRLWACDITDHIAPGYSSVCLPFNSTTLNAISGAVAIEGSHFVRVLSNGDVIAW
jgi:hypothetical protein